MNQAAMPPARHKIICKWRFKFAKVRHSGTKKHGPSCAQLDASIHSNFKIIQITQSLTPMNSPTKFLPTHTKTDLSRRRLLVVDEAPQELLLLLNLLQTTTIQQQIALSGQEGLNKAILFQPDLVLLDISLRGMDGFGVYRQFREQASTMHIPVIFMSALNRLEDRLLGLSMGAVDYLSKPFNEHEALARINIHLELSRNVKRLNHLPSKTKLSNMATNAPAAKEADASGEFVRYERRMDVIVRIATRHLKENLGMPHTPVQLAQFVGTTEKGLNQAFLSTFGMTTFAWLREERMRHARHLLMNTDIAIANIGDYVGFKSPANFSRSFRDRFVMSPRDMRMGRSEGIDAAVL
jgi:DNA-binding response OmpR family regulator